MSSVADFEAQLLYPSVIVQAKGFSGLVKTLLSCKDTKEKNAANDVLWKILRCGSGMSASWVVEVVPVLLERHIAAYERVINECFYALSESVNVSQITSLLFSVTSDFIECCLQAIRLVPQCRREVLVAQISCGLLHRSFGCMIRLILGNELSTVEKQSLILSTIKDGSSHQAVTLLRVYSHLDFKIIEFAPETTYKNELLLRKAGFCSETLLSCLKLDYPRCLFVLCEQLAQGSYKTVCGLLGNPSFPVHSALVYSLSAVYACFSEWLRNSDVAILFPAAPSESGDCSLKGTLQKLGSLIRICQNHKFPCDERDIEPKGTTHAEYFKWIVSSPARVSNFLKQWSSNSGKQVSSLHISFLAGFIPYLTEDVVDYFFSLVVDFVTAENHLADGILLFCLQFMQKKGELRTKCLRWISHLAVNKSVHGSVFKLLFAVSNGSDLTERITAINSLQYLWNHSRWASFDEFYEVVKINLEKDPPAVYTAKFAIVRNICQNSNRAEDLLPTLSSMLNREGPLLPHAMMAVGELCRIQVLEIESVLQMLSTKVYQLNDEEVLCTFCTLLAISSELSEDGKECQQDCINRLWALTVNKYPSVQISAWRALAAFSVEDIQIAIGNDATEGYEFKALVMQTLEKVQSIDVALGVSKCLSSVFSSEVENLGRALYIAAKNPPASTDFLSELAPRLCTWETALATCDYSALSLLESFCSSIQSIGKRKPEILRMLRKLLLEVSVPVHDEWLSVKYLVSWRKAMEASYRILSKLSSTQKSSQLLPDLARNEICDVMRNALSESDNSLPNIIISLPFLANCAIVDETWRISVISFLMRCIDEKLGCSYSPLFRQNVKHSKTPTVLAYFANALLFRSFGATKACDEECLRNLLSAADKSTLTGFRWLVDMADSFLDNLPNTTESEVASISLLLSDTNLIKKKSVEMKKWRRSEIALVGCLISADWTAVQCFIDQFCVTEDYEKPLLRLLSEEQLTLDQLLGLFEMVNNSDVNVTKQHSSKVAKKLLKTATADNSLLASVLEGIAINHLISQQNVAFMPPNSYSMLPENSFLRTVVERVQEGFSSSKQAGLYTALNALCTCRMRSDGRSLPPLNWIFLLDDLRTSGSEIQLCIFRIAVREKDAKLLCRIILCETFCLSSPPFLDEVLTSLEELQQILPLSYMKYLISALFELAREEKQQQKIFSALALIAPANSYVIKMWSAELPCILSASTCEKPVFQCFSKVLLPESLAHGNSLLEIWIVSKDSTNGLNVDSVMRTFRKIEDDNWLLLSQKRASALLILSNNLFNLQDQQRWESMLQLFTECSAASIKSPFTELGLFWHLFIALCTTRASAEIPVLSIAEQDITAWEWIETRAVHHFKEIVSQTSFWPDLDKLANFLLLLLRFALKSEGKNADTALMAERIRELLLELLPVDAAVLECVDSYHMWDEIFL